MLILVRASVAALIASHLEYKIVSHLEYKKKLSKKQFSKNSLNPNKISWGFSDFFSE